MKLIRSLSKAICFILAISILAACSSSTVITSVPEGAKLYLDEEYVGETPYRHSDKKITGTSMLVRINKEGYSPFETTITRSEEVDPGAVVGGLFFLFPFAWTMGYKPKHTYELTPLAPLSPQTANPQTLNKSETDQLDAKARRELAEKLREMARELEAGQDSAKLPSK